MVSTDYLDRVSPLPPLPGSLPRVISRHQAAAFGISLRTLQRYVAAGRWRRLLPATYLTVSSRPTELDRWVAALLFAGEGAAVSSAGALRAVGVRGIAQPERVLVLVPPQNRKESNAWVTVRRTCRPIEVTQWHGPRCVQAARAVADYCLTLERLDDARAAVAKVVQQGHGTVAEIGAELEAGPRRGSHNLRLALEEVGWGAESAPEARALRLLRRAGIRDFVANAWLQLGDGSWRRVDAYWPHLRFSLEMDGKEWHFTGKLWVKGLERDVALAKIGVYGVHRPPSALYDAAGFVADVRDLIAARQADLRLGLGPDVADATTPRWVTQR
jgi:hypothetical protein